MNNNKHPHGSWLGLACAIVIFSGYAYAEEAPGKTLTLGMLPSRSTVTLYQRFAPLRDYLSEKLGYKLVFETTPDYDLFLKQSQQGKYDFILTAPHYALLTMDSGYYDISATYKNPLAAVILVHQQSNIKSLHELAGKQIATPPLQAIITMAGKHYLSKSGLTGSKKPVYILSRTHSASLHTVLVKESDAAIVSTNVARHAQNRGYPVRKLAQSPDIPSMAWLVAKRLPYRLREQFGNLLINMHKNAEGRKVLKKINYDGYRKATRQEFEPVRAYLNSNWK